jgi:hypothetical protein
MKKGHNNKDRGGGSIVAFIKREALPKITFVLSADT